MRYTSSSLFLTLFSHGEPMNKKYVTKAKVVFKGRNSNLSFFIEDYLSQQICSRWGSSEITENNVDITYTKISFEWFYNNMNDASEDCHCISQCLSTLKKAGIIDWFYANSCSVENIQFQKEPSFNAVNFS